MRTLLGEINLQIRDDGCYENIPANSHALSLTPAGWKLRSHAYSRLGPISHAWLKNVSCCRLAWHNFQKYVNSDPCKDRKPCVKCINDNYLSRDLWFLKWKALGASSRLYWDWDFGRFRKTLGFFGRLRTSSGVFGNYRVIFKNLSTTRIKISRLYLRKSWQVYEN